MYIVKLKKGKEKKILNGYPWIYANEVQEISGKDIKGAIAKVVSNDGKFICQGFINHLSKILIRVLSFNEEEIGYEFFFNRIKRAYEEKLELGYNNNFRVIFSENDLIPGLIVDKYGDYLSISITCLGIEVRKDLILKALIQIISPKGIYERSDVKTREKEGLKFTSGIIYGDFDPRVIIEENGLKLIVDLEKGQKTGYFLDQKENRDNLKHYVKGKEVLDCFCNEGGFSLCAAKYGAKSVLSLDISDFALDLVNENAKLNNLDKIISTEKADVFEKLRDLRRDKKKFDVIILDPPAFTKSSDTVKEGIKGYKDINIQGLKLVKKGGYLVTCSCSQHLTLNLFLDMIKDSIIESGVSCKLIELRTQSRDHGTLVTFDEGLYLKVAVLKII